MKVIWQPSARKDRDQIFGFIEQDNPAAAVKMDLLFSHAAKRLARLPEIGRPGSIAGTRELIPHRQYRLVYRIVGSEVRILSLVHTARQWPPVEEAD
ncbi:MAG: type II toxin-antitoxin system RelE/ParE family toxin [Rhizobiaceae bacterium]|nr:type II toxin-antitoxin system RelE/ParE family toxin [Rhizobiaceae bacterium]